MFHQQTTTDPTGGSTGPPGPPSGPSTVDQGRRSNGKRRQATLRIAYVGPNMDLVQAAYRDDHEQPSHETMHVRSVPDVRLLHPMPDVVVLNPMVVTTEGVAGACALQAIVPANTLIVAIYSSLGNSHTMYTRHALAGDCHRHMLLHYPSPTLQSERVVNKIDRMARAHGGGPRIDTTGHLPDELTAASGTTNLGRLLFEDSQNHRSETSLTYARLLYVAAVDPTWATWRDLANQLGFAEGHVKNVKAKLGRAIHSRVLPGRAQDVGVPLDQRKAWRIAEFTRFVTEHRSFIRAYCEHHLSLNLALYG